MAPAQDSHVLAAVPLPRRGILDAAVSMNRVIPLGKGMHPVTRRGQRGKALACKARGVLQGAKQGLGAGIVVADTRTAEGRSDSKPPQ